MFEEFYDNLKNLLPSQKNMFVNLMVLMFNKICVKSIAKDERSKGFNSEWKLYFSLNKYFLFYLIKNTLWKHIKLLRKRFPHSNNKVYTWMVDVLNPLKENGQNESQKRRYSSSQQRQKRYGKGEQVVGKTKDESFRILLRSRTASLV